MNTPNFIDFLSQKDCVIWDWNGTLLDDLDYSLGVTNSILKEVMAPEVSKKKYIENFTIPVCDYYQFLNLETKISFQKMSEEFVSRYYKERFTPSLFRGARECLELAKNNTQIKQILFSAAHIEELEFQISHHKINDCFDYLSGAMDYAGGSKLERGKKLKELFNPERGVLIGDTLHDIEVGKELNLETVWVSEGHQCLSRALVNDCVDYILDRKENTFYKRA